MATVEDSRVTSRDYDDTVAKISHDLLFLRSEWGRLNKSSKAASDRLGVIEKSLGTYETRFDSLDRRFDQLTQILTHMELNQKTEEAHRKSVFLGHESPILQSAACSALETSNIGFHIPPSDCETRESLLTKIDMPHFDGTSLFGWIARAEHFFRVRQISDEERLGRISGCLEGDALFWYKRELASRDFMNWGEFKRRLLARFAPVKRSSRQAVQLKKELISHIVEMPKAMPAEDSLQEEQSQESSDSQMAIKVSDEENSITEPQVPLNVLESGHQDKLLGAFETNIVCKVQKQVLPPICDDFQSVGVAGFDLSTGFKITQCAYQMLDVLHLQKETMDMRLEKDKLSKSWKFKFKLRTTTSVVNKAHLLSKDSTLEKIVEAVDHTKANDVHFEQTKETSRNMLEKVEISVSAYDTSWVAMVPSPSSQNAPFSPQCVNWLLEDQHEDGSWGLDNHNHLSLTMDLLSFTLACLLALKRWGTGERQKSKDHQFIELNSVSVTDDTIQGPSKLDIIIRGLIEYANDLNMAIPLSSEMVDAMIQKRDLDLGSDSARLSTGREAYMDYVLEGPRKIQDGDVIGKYQRKNSSRFDSPAIIAAVFTSFRNDRCLCYLSRLHFSVHLKASSCLPNACSSDILHLAVEDFNFCQSVHVEVMKRLARWIVEIRLQELKFGRQKLAYCYFSRAATFFSSELSDAHISWAKGGALTTVVVDFFDIGGSKEVMENLIHLVEKWDLNCAHEYCSEQVQILLSVLRVQISQLGLFATKRFVSVVELVLTLLELHTQTSDRVRDKAGQFQHQFRILSYRKEMRRKDNVLRKEELQPVQAKLGDQDMIIAETLLQISLQQRQPTTKCCKTWMFKYKLRPYKKEAWTENLPHHIHGVLVFDIGGVETLTSSDYGKLSGALGAQGMNFVVGPRVPLILAALQPVLQGRDWLLLQVHYQGKQVQLIFQKTVAFSSSEMEYTDGTTLGKSSLLIQLVGTFLRLQLYVAHTAVTTGGHKLFVVWHRWRIRDSVQCAYCIMEHWFHLQSSQVGAFWRSSSLVNMSQVLVPQLLSFQLEDKLHLKGWGIDRFQKLRGAGARRRKHGIQLKRRS